MADINEFKERMRRLQEELRNQLPDIATTLTLSGKALAERRIKDKGFGAVYSTNKIPSWFLRGKQLNKSGDAFLDLVDDKAEGLTNWGEFRAAQGLQTAHTDLSYSNKMWANMQPMEVQVQGDIYRAPLGATNREAQDKMNWNRDRYQDFVGKALTPEDFNTLGEVVISEVIRALQQIKF